MKFVFPVLSLVRMKSTSDNDDDEKEKAELTRT